MAQDIISSATEPANTLHVPTVGGDTDTWGNILVEETFVMLLGYILWLYENMPVVEIDWGEIGGTLGDQTDLAAALSDTATAAQGALADSAVQPGDPVSVNAQTGTSYTLVLSDNGKLITLDNASPITLTIPTNASVAFTVNSVVAAAQLGTGQVTIQGDTGVTVNGTSGGSVEISNRFATVALTKLATDTWLVSGGLAE